MDLGGFCICYSVKHFTYFDTNIVTIPINSTLDPFFAFNSQTNSDLPSEASYRAQKMLSMHVLVVGTSKCRF